MEWYLVLILVFAIPIILFPAAFVWYLNVGGLYALVRQARQRSAAREHETAEASVFTIMGRGVRPGILVVARAMRTALPFAVPAGVYAFFIWLFFAGLGWGVALAIGLAIPIVLVPVAFVWYLNVSGLYRVIVDARERQKSRARVTGEVEVDSRKAMVGVVVGSKTGM